MRLVTRPKLKSDHAFVPDPAVQIPGVGYIEGFGLAEGWEGGGGGGYFLQFRIGECCQDS